MTTSTIAATEDSLQRECLANLQDVPGCEGLMTSIQGTIAVAQTEGCSQVTPLHVTLLVFVLCCALDGSSWPYFSK